MTTKDSAEGLLPCPFCGSHAVSHSVGVTKDGKDWHYVECEDCSACAEPDFWNRRAYLAQGDGGWIKCSERLPEDYCDVLIFCPKQRAEGFDLIFMAQIHRDGNLAEFWADGEDEPMEPTHWRPLPLPPADDQGE